METAAQKRARKLERLQSQCPPKTYKHKPQPQEDKPFVPSRPLMKQRLTEEALKTESVKQNIKLGDFDPKMTRQQKRRSLRNIVKSAVNDIREKMIKEMQHGEHHQS